MSLWSWAKGAVSDVGDWLGGAWDTVSGKSNFQANPYTTDLSSGYVPLEQLAARQESSATPYIRSLQDLTGGMISQGNATRNDLNALALAAGNAGRSGAVDQRGIGANLAGLGAAYGGRFDTLSGDALQRAAAGGQQISGIGTDMARTGAQYAGSQGAIANELQTGPSVAEAMGRAEAARADQDMAARLAGARGANTNLLLRDAAQSGQMQRANLSAQLATAAAAERLQRQQAASGVLDTAARTQFAGQGAQLGAAQSAAQLGLAGNAQAGQQLAQGANAAMGGQQGLLAATQGATSSELAGNAQAMSGTSAAGNAGMTGLQGAAAAQQAAGGMQLQAGQAAANTLANAAQTRTAQEQINAGSHDSANAANAGVQTSNAKNQSEMTGGLLKGAALAAVSDIRAKQDVHLLGPTGNPYHESTASGIQDPKSGNSWSDLSSILAQASKGHGSSMMLSDESAKENRQALEPLHPYSYRYKPDVAERIGEDTEPRIGVMAQDLEKSPEAKGSVIETENGKGIDVNRGLSFALAAAAGLDKRVRELEKKKR